jgi:hypothetical protein
MDLRNRFGLGIATVALGVVSALGLAACGSATTATTSMSPEASALTALGFADTDVTAGDGSDATTMDAAAHNAADGGAAPDSTAGPDTAKKKDGKRHPLLRRLAIRRGLAKHIQHGEITVSTKNGDKTIEVQRGTITDISATTVTVQCTDGFTMTWTFGSPIHVIEHRATVQPTDLEAGDVIGVAGIKDGDTDTAKLIVVPNAAKSTTGS